MSNPEDGAPEPFVHVPGARAPEIDVAAFVNSWPRLMLKCAGRLSAFLHGILSGAPLLCDEGTPTHALWPVPLPYPEVFRSGADGAKSWKKRRLCLQLVVLNWLYLGQANGAPKSLCLGRKLTPGQWRIVRLLESLADDANSVQKVDAMGMGRSAAKVETQDEEIAALHRALVQVQHATSFYGAATCSMPSRSADESEPRYSGAAVGKLQKKPFVTAKALEASRLQFGPAPAFDPLPYMDSKTAAMYVEPGLFHKADPEPPPRVHVRASAEEKMRLYEKLACTGRLRLLRLDEVEELYASGLFAVVKDLERDRLIMDSRPANSRERGLNHWCGSLASASMLGQIMLENDEKLCMSGEDVKDFFYQFLVSPARAARNALVGKLTMEELLRLFPGHDVPPEGGFVGLNTMAMGDLCAVEFAQSSHLSLVLQCGGICPTELMRLRSPMPRGPFMGGLVIDDLVLLERVLKKSRGFPTAASRRLKTIKQKYKEVGLPVNEKKEFVDATSARFWGAEVDGDAGIVRANSFRVWPLMLVTLRVCCLGVSSVSLLESLCGSWISVLMFRRRTLSVLNEIFLVLHSGLLQNDIVRLSEGLRDELVAIVVLGTLAYVNMRATVLPTFRASDASDWGCAAVSAELPSEVAKETMRFSLSRSLWSRLLPPGKAWLKQKGLLSYAEELPEEEFYDTHPLWELLARGLTFTTEWRRPHARAVHINVAELSAHLREEKKLCEKYESFRCLYGLDSQVALGALVKGRSSSRSLNRLLQRSLLPMFSADAYSGVGFLPSAINRADAPTRDRVVEQPDMQLPEWWEELASGVFKKFDAWLEALSKTLPAARDPFDFEELGYRKALKLETGRHERRERHFGKKAQQPVEAEPSFLGSFCPQQPGAGALCDEAVGLLKQLDERKQIWWPKGSLRVFEQPGAMDLYTGRGGVAKQLLKCGAPFVVTFDWSRSAQENLLWPENKQMVLRLIELKAVKVVGSAIICKSFTRAITPAVRSRRFPRGLPWMRSTMRQSVEEGNSHGDFCKEVIKACEKASVIFWLENPDTSFLWLQRGYRRFAAPDSNWVFRTDFCRYGTAWRKRTRVATNCTSLRGLRMLCTCKKGHLVLRGTHPTLRKPWTAVAEPYPRGFCAVVGGALASEVGWCQRLNVAGCSRTGSLRIGEAKNPGPRNFRLPRDMSLEHMPQQLAASIALGDRCWSAFYNWASESFEKADPLQLFLEVPLFLAHAVRKYGDMQFSNGGSLLYYRHLVLSAQRRVPNLKQYVHLCWELAGRWELAEPVKHRVPLPLPVLQGMVALSMLMGWRQWAGITLLCFFGVARVGEVLRCRGKHLLLPGDLLDEAGNSVFLLLESSKTSRRTAARVQHLKITDEHVAKLLGRIFAPLEKEAYLFGGSPSAFRTRWNSLLATLTIPPTAALTPGGLRGGGAVESYRRGIPISDIQWRMRLKNQATLESYLQEVAALSALTQLPNEALVSIRSAAKLYQHLR